MTHRTGAIFMLVLVLSACAAGESTSDISDGPPSADLTPPADCVNPPPDITTLVDQHDPLACYGGADVTVAARAMGLGTVDCPGGLEPAWLSCAALIGLYPLPETSRLSGVILAARSQDFGEPLYAVFHPDIAERRGPTSDAIVTVTGHYDDPAALACHNTSWPPGGDPPSVEEVIHGCRTTFVITALEQFEPAPAGQESSPSQEPTSALAPGGVVQAVDTDIVVRSAPGTGTDSEIYADSISPPTLAYVFAGPVPIDGYDWYHVLPADLGYLPSPYQAGWIAAASREGAPWIAPAAPECPEPALEPIVALSPTGRLSCFADSPLTLEGVLGECSATSFITDASGSVTLEQPWTGACALFTSQVVPDARTLTIRFGEAVALPIDAGGQRIRVSGHFDDAASASCAVTGDDWSDFRVRGDDDLPPGWAEFLCRTEFVVTDVEQVQSS